jgi:hypothetical protein
VTSTVIFRKGVELSRLQSLALTLSDKASALIETNERQKPRQVSLDENCRLSHVLPVHLFFERSYPLPAWVSTTGRYRN